VRADARGWKGDEIRELPKSLVLRGARTLPGLILVAVLLVLTSAGGGYAPTSWYPAALFLLALLVVVVISDRAAFAAVARTNLVAFAFIGGLAAWSLLSILWAGAKDDAWDGGNRVVMYLIVFALVGLIPSTPRRSAVILGTFSLGIAVLTGAAFLFGDPGTTFTNGRLAEPVGYASATAALCLMAVWPAVALGVAREAAIVVRGLMLGCAAVLVQFAVLAESRGAVLALPLAALVYVVLVPGRARVLFALLLLALVGYLTWEPLTDVFAAVREDNSAALTHARGVVVVTFAAAFAIGVLLALADRRIPVSAAWARRGARGFQVAVLVVLLLGVGAWIAREGDPLDRAEAAWRDFKSGYPDSFGDSRLTGELGTDRYDFWRVGLLMFRDQPLLGAGADNFSLEYVQDRRTGEEPTYPHSIAVEVLSQTGIVGAALFAAGLLVAFVAFLRKRRALDDFGRLIAASAISGFVYWLLHASVDWFWELPVLGAAAFMYLGLAVATSPDTDGARDYDYRPAAWARALGLVACVAVALSFVFPWLSARAISEALAVWRSDPNAAQVRLEQARELNPLTDRADEIAGAIGSRTGDLATMRRSFERAVERNPENWYSRLELGIAYALGGDDDAALTELGIAEELNPRERVIHDVRAGVLLGLPLSPAGIDARFLARAEKRAR
jgi:tetratricopeptide (TPR) repeat protein